MKFGKTIESHLTSEWREQYLQYADLKNLIRRGVNNAPNPNTAKREQIDRYYKEFANEFFAACDNELSRVNNFYAQKWAEARRKHATLKINLLTAARAAGQQTENLLPMALPASENTRAHPSDFRRLRHSYSEFYLSLILLQNYQKLNLTAFRKICKKYDKYIKSKDATAWFNQNVIDAPFTYGHELSQMILEVENLYTKYLANGDRTKAMAKLRVPPLEERTQPETVFQAGVLMGLCTVSVCICVLSFIYFRSEHELVHLFVRLHRGPIIFIVYCFYIVLNVKIWEQVGVNHKLIFELDPRNHLLVCHLLLVVGGLSYFYLLCMIFYFHYDIMSTGKPYNLPFVIIVFTLVLLLNPTCTMQYPARIWLLRVLGRTMAAPFFYVRFSDFWMGDQMNSLSNCFVDFYLMLRFYYYYWRYQTTTFDAGPDVATVLILCLPPWSRLAQCLRRYRDSSSKSIDYLINAFKYGTSLVVIGFSTWFSLSQANYERLHQNPIFWCYLTAITFSTLVSTAWDLTQDFSLLKIWQGENVLLRKNLLYAKSYYYFMIVEDVLLRFFWIAKLYLTENGILSGYDANTLASFLEVTRRFFWNFGRLENEHLNNAGQYRATRDIFISTLDVHQEKILERMMDEEDAVTSGSKPAPLNKKYF